MTPTESLYRRGRAVYSPAGALDAVGGFGRGAAEDADWSTAAINQAHVMLCENYELSGHSSKCPGTLLCRGIHSRPPAPPVQEHCRASSLPCGLPRRAFLLGEEGKKREASRHIHSWSEIERFRMQAPSASLHAHGIGHELKAFDLRD